MTVRNVQITLKEYQRLIERDNELYQLEVCGVDNWSGYGEYDDLTGNDGEQNIADAVKQCETKVV